MMTIKEIMKSSGISPLDAELLLSCALKKPKEYLFSYPEKKLSLRQWEKFKNLARRRKTGMPIAYLVGKKEFFGLDFHVDKNVLIPRPETEITVEQIIAKLQESRKDNPSTVIDVGTGSGNIIVSIAKNISPMRSRKKKMFAVDVSEEALRIARRNARKNFVSEKIKFAKSNLLEYFLKNKQTLKSGELIVVANLPYVSSKLYKKYRGNLRFEPKSALVSNSKGLAHYKKLLQQIRSLLPVIRGSVSIFIEISPEQKSPISRLVSEVFAVNEVKFSKDLAGKSRVAEITLSRV
jgi:release factor glutamine methyltransferase